MKESELREILEELKFTDPLSNLDYKIRGNKMIDLAITQIFELFEVRVSEICQHDWQVDMWGKTSSGSGQKMRCRKCLVVTWIFD